MAQTSDTQPNWVLKVRCMQTQNTCKHMASWHIFFTHSVRI